MPSPFIGMNPYLENPSLWSQVHTHLIVAIAEKMNPILRPKYRMAMEQRVYTEIDNNHSSSQLVGIPDNVIFQTGIQPKLSDSSNISIKSPQVKPQLITIPQPEEIKEWYLQVQDVETKQVVTVIEILSPKNKKKGEGRKKYLQKRADILMSLTHLIEIDLLRSGELMPMNLDNTTKHDYSVLISRSERRPQAELYAFNLSQEIPSIPLPLQPEDKEPLIPLQELLHNIYDKGSYDLAINYQTPLSPALSPSDQIWVDNLLTEQGLR